MSWECAGFTRSGVINLSLSKPLHSGVRSRRNRKSSRQSQDEADGVTPAGFFCGNTRPPPATRQLATGPHVALLPCAGRMAVGFLRSQSLKPYASAPEPGRFGIRVPADLARPIGVERVCQENTDAEEHEDCTNDVCNHVAVHEEKSKRTHKLSCRWERHLFQTPNINLRSQRRRTSPVEWATTLGAREHGPASVRSWHSYQPPGDFGAGNSGPEILAVNQIEDGG